MSDNTDLPDDPGAEDIPGETDARHDPRDPTSMINREAVNVDAVEESRAQGGEGMATTDSELDAETDVAARLGVVEDPSLATGRGEGVGESKEVAGLSQGRIVLGRFVRHAGALFGMITLLTIALVSFLSMGIGPIPGLWRNQDPNKSADVVNGGAPTLDFFGIIGGSGFRLGDYPFGQNTIGQDNFAQVMTGIQTSLIVMFIMAIVAMVIGVTIGALAGYYRGWLDSLLMRFTDLVITLPVLVIGSVLGILLKNLPQKWGWSDAVKDGIQTAMPVLLAVALGTILWPGLARLVRSEFLSLREREFVDSARVAGASNVRIILKHVLPNCIGVIIVNITLLMSASVVLESALSYLNFGIQFPSISLGLLISNNQSAFDTRPWLFWWPGLFIILLALSVNFIGDGLRDAFDPRSKRIPSQRKLDRTMRQQLTSASGITTAGGS